MRGILVVNNAEKNYGFLTKLWCCYNMVKITFQQQISLKKVIKPHSTNLRNVCCGAKTPFILKNCNLDNGNPVGLLT